MIWSEIPDTDVKFSAVQVDAVNRRDERFVKEIESLRLNNDILKTALGRIIQGWHPVFIERDQIAAAMDWAAANVERFLKVESFLFFTGENITENHRDGHVVVVESKDQAALLKTFFG